MHNITHTHTDTFIGLMNLSYLFALLYFHTAFIFHKKNAVPFYFWFRFFSAFFIIYVIDFCFPMCDGTGGRILFLECEIFGSLFFCWFFRFCMIVFLPFRKSWIKEKYVCSMQVPGFQRKLKSLRHFKASIVLRLNIATTTLERKIRSGWIFHKFSRKHFKCEPIQAKRFNILIEVA